MNKTGIFYGSTTGNTGSAAKKIRDLLGIADLKKINADSINEMQNYDVLFLGVSTWGVGELQEDWESVFSIIPSLDLSGKKVALFGTGDQFAYSYTFADGLGILYDAFKNSNAEFIGEWSSAGYEYEESRAERNGKFVGLVIDDDNQTNITDERIEKWIDSLNL